MLIHKAKKEKLKGELLWFNVNREKYSGRVSIDGRNRVHLINKMVYIVWYTVHNREKGGWCVIREMLF